MQDLNSTDVSQVSISQHMLQENDILKIDVTSLEEKASIPYNKISSSRIISGILLI